MKRYILAAALAAVCGCATTANYKKAVGSWVGADAQKLVDSWGYPARTFPAPDGNTVYEYSSSETYQTSRFTTYTYDPRTGAGYASTYGGDTLNFYCRTYFELDAARKVVKATFQGNSCKAAAPQEGRAPRP